MFARPRDWLLVPLVFGLTCVCLFWGGRNSWRSLRNLSPTELTCAEFFEHRPSAEWVRLSSCVPDFSHMAVLTYSRANGLGNPEVSEVYIPLWPEHAAHGSKAKVVLSANRYPLLVLGDRNATQASTDEAMFALDKPIDGLVEGILDRSEKQRVEIKELGLHVDDEFVIVEWSARPRPVWLSLGVLALGGVGFWWLRRKWRRRRKAPAVAKATIVNG